MLTEKEKADAFDKLKIQLERLGADKTKIDKGELTETDIADVVVKDTKRVQPIIDEAIKKQDALLIEKMNKQAIALGIKKEDVEATGGDIKKLFGAVNEHLKATLGKSDDEKTKKLEEFSTKLREQELLLSKEKEEREKVIKEHEAKIVAERSAFKRSSATRGALLKVGLTEDVMNNIDTYQRVIESELSDMADFEEKEGKLFAFKKGTKDKFFKDGSSEQMTLDDMIAKRATELKWKKVSGVGGQGNPGNGGAGGEVKTEKVWNRAEGKYVDVPVAR